MKLKLIIVGCLLLAMLKVSATEVSTTEVDGNWRTISITGSFADPVVFTGVISNNDINPGVIKVQNVTPTSFDIKFENWGYLLDQGLVHGTETVPYMVLEKGRTVMTDKSVWEVGSFNLGSSKVFRFEESFDSAPVVLISPQASVADYTTALHARSITENGFVGIQRQQIANYDSEGRFWSVPYRTLEVAYVAIQKPTKPGKRDGLEYQVSVDGVSHMSSPIVGEFHSVFFQEEVSTGHSGVRAINDVSGLEIDGKLFASDAQYVDGTAATIRLANWQQTYATCKDAYDKGQRRSGFYSIDPDRDGPVKPFSVYCDQETLGGGWTLVANHHDEIADKQAVSPARPTAYGMLSGEQWRAVRDSMNDGMMFIDEFERVSMISKAKLLSGNLTNISQVEDLTSETYILNDKDETTGIKSMIRVRPGDRSYPASASLNEGSTIKFDIWPYDRYYSYKEQDELLYFVR